jgi:hypothetical protein
VSAAPIGEDLALAYRQITKGADVKTPQDVRVARVAPDGRSTWDTSLGLGGVPAIAVGHDRVAAIIKDGSTGGQAIAILRADTGLLVKRRGLAAALGGHCIAPTSRGWLLVRAAEPDVVAGREEQRPPSSVALTPDGAPEAVRELPQPFDSCALLAVKDGFALAYTHHKSAVPHASFLFVRMLDPSGGAHGEPKQVLGVTSARSPYLAESEAGPILLFEDTVGRTVHGVALDPHGVPRGPVQGVAHTVGLTSFALWDNELVWSTEGQLARRGCLSELFPSAVP